MAKRKLDAIRHEIAGHLAYTLGFGRDEYEDLELPEGTVDEKAKAAWQKGWDEAATTPPTGEE